MSASLADALSAQDFAQAAQICELAELDAAAASQPHPHPAEHLLVLLLQDNLPAARFLWRRLQGPARLTTAPAWALAHAQWCGDRQALYTAAASTSWSPSLAPLAATLAARTRARAAALVSRAYVTVSRQRLVSMLGIDGEELDAFCIARGWRVDAAFVVVGGPDATSSSTPEERAVRASFAELQTLTEQLVRLQTTS